MSDTSNSWFRDIAPEHPFAQYVRILGKGKTGTRSLSADEAEAAMGMILRGEVEDEQLGAFMMLLRVKEESQEELCGFVRAVRESIGQPNVQVDLDWASYAGKRRQQPWYLLAALCLAQAGYRVLMHGAGGHTHGRVYSEEALDFLGLPVVHNWEDANTALDQTNFAFIPLSAFCPPLQRVIALRNHFGLRSPVHTLSRLINPCGASHSLQSIFHPAYGESHQQAAQLLGQQHAAVFKGEAGEAERKPEAKTLVRSLRDGEAVEQLWPPLISGRQEKLEQLNPADFIAVWRGERKDNYGEQAVIGTLAIALNLLEDLDQNAALSRANTLWDARDKKRLTG